MAPKTKTPAATNGAPKPVVDKKAQDKDTSESHVGRPDKKVYDDEQERLKAEIEALQTKLNAVREKISLTTKGGNGNDRRNQLRAELDGLRGQQSNNKASRGKVLDQLKALQDGIQKKIKDIQAAQTKIPYKNVAEVDNRIKALEKQVESGNLKLADEKRALQEISTCKRSRRTVEGFQAIQDSIEADRKVIEDLRAQLDDPEFKATSDRFDTIKAELDELKKQGDEAYAGRSKLFEERDGYQDKINALWSEKRDSTQKFREANDTYWNKVNEDRARRAERARAQRAAEELEKKQEQAKLIREEAEFPAYEPEIQDCQTLIDHFSGKTTGTVTLKSAPEAFEKAEVTGVPKLEIRQVDAAPEGLVVRKKKGEDEDNYFVASKTKGQGKGKGKKTPTPKPQAEEKEKEKDSGKLNVPLPILVTLSKFAIPLPNSAADVPRVVQDLTTKKAWYLANQERQTKENIAKAEARIKSLAVNAANTAASPAANDLVVPNGDGERPPEPSPTPNGDGPLDDPVQSEPVDEKLEAVIENDS